MHLPNGEARDRQERHVGGRERAGGHGLRLAGRTASRWAARRAPRRSSGRESTIRAGADRAQAPGPRLVRGIRSGRRPADGRRGLRRERRPRQPRGRAARQGALRGALRDGARASGLFAARVCDFARPRVSRRPAFGRSHDRAGASGLAPDRPRRARLRAGARRARRALHRLRDDGDAVRGPRRQAGDPDRRRARRHDRDDPLRLPDAPEVLVRHLLRMPPAARLPALLRRAHRQRAVLDPHRPVPVPAGGALQDRDGAARRVSLRERGRRPAARRDPLQARSDRGAADPSRLPAARHGPRDHVPAAPLRRALLRRTARAGLGRDRADRRRGARRRLVPAEGLPEGAHRDVPEPRQRRARVGVPGAPVEDRGRARAASRARASAAGRRASSGSCPSSTPTSSSPSSPRSGGSSA